MRASANHIAMETIIRARREDPYKTRLRNLSLVYQLFHRQKKPDVSRTSGRSNDRRSSLPKAVYERLLLSVDPHHHATISGVTSNLRGTGTVATTADRLVGTGTVSRDAAGGQTTIDQQTTHGLCTLEA